MDWIWHLINAISDWLRVKFDSSSLAILASKDCIQNKMCTATVRLIEADFSGIVDWKREITSTTPSPGVWLISHKTSDQSFLLALINIEQYKQNQCFLDTGVHFNRKFDLEAKNYYTNQENVIGTHILLTAWIDNLPTKHRSFALDTTGSALVEIDKLYKSIELHSFDVLNLQLSMYDGDRLARTIVMQIVERIATKLWVPNSTVLWKQIVKSINVYQWVQNLGIYVLGSDHIFKPIKPD